LQWSVRSCIRLSYLTVLTNRHLVYFSVLGTWHTVSTHRRLNEARGVGTSVQWQACMAPHPRNIRICRESRVPCRVNGRMCRIANCLSAMAARLVSPKSSPCEPCDHGGCHRQTRPRQQPRRRSEPAVKKDAKAGRDYATEVEEGDSEPGRRSKVSPGHTPPRQRQGVCRRRWILMPWMEDRTALLLVGQHVRICRWVCLGRRHYWSDD
jgi:hypothetical protein